MTTQDRLTRLQNTLALLRSTGDAYGLVETALLALLDDRIDELREKLLEEQATSR